MEDEHNFNERPGAFSMGYSHYFYRPRILEVSTFRAFVRDVASLLAALSDLGLPLAGADGTGEPIVKPNLVSFNGKTGCGHPKNESVVIPWPADNAGGIALTGQDAIAGEWFAGALLSSRICNGDCSYETFHLPRVYVPEGWEQPKNGVFPAFCKTAFRPYDLPVIAILVCFKKHFGDAVRVASDGTDEQWFDGKLLCKRVLDFGFEFQINESGELVKKQNTKPVSS